MINLDFKYIAAKNFFCFGPEGISLDLTLYKNIVLVHGENMDVMASGGEDSRNGVGKSSLPDIIVYTLYGKTLKKGLTHKQVINNATKKKLRTEVCWDKYRVVRERKPDSLRFWECEYGVWDLHVTCPTTGEHIVVEEEKDGIATNSKGKDFSYTEDDVINPEITLGGMPATESLIEDKIGLNYVTFCNIMVFTDDNKGSFLECDAKTKREIVENLLSLDRYRGYGEQAKSVRNGAKAKIKNIGNEYEHLLTELSLYKNRVIKIESEEKNWRDQKEQELRRIMTNITTKQSELETSDIGKALNKWNEAQDEIKELNGKIPTLESARSKVEEISSEAELRLDKTREEKHANTLRIKELESEVVKSENEILEYNSKIEKLKNNEDATCDQCYGTIKKENAEYYSKSKEKAIEETQASLKDSVKQIVILQDESEILNETIKKLSAGIKTAKEKLQETVSEISKSRTKISELNKIKQPEAGTSERILEEQIEELKKQALSKKKEWQGDSPFVDIYKSAKEEVGVKQKEADDKNTELINAEEELPYYEYWVKAFGDKGIRKFVIDGIIPALNSRTAYWLQFLIDGAIDLKFDNQLTETIERNPKDGDPFVYAQMSMGEKRRLNLTVSQAFAHVMMINTGCVPSCVFLDEVTTNIDPVGVVGVYNMITELAKDRQVFITTHDAGLLEMLGGCDAIHLVRKDGFTKVK
ncbi:MAG: AAA family ATPase [Candidatus Thorarchaeota archaeon]|jgi:DNA repair exonuclease SbcCD ATPase subunit